MRRKYDYGSDMFGYMFCDDENKKKFLRHYDMIFNENVMYNDKEKRCSGTTKQMFRDNEANVPGQRSKWELRLNCEKIPLVIL